jgi:hypothetical protein
VRQRGGYTCQALVALEPVLRSRIDSASGLPPTPKPLAVGWSFQGVAERKAAAPFSCRGTLPGVPVLLLMARSFFLAIMVGVVVFVALLAMMVG